MDFTIHFFLRKIQHNLSRIFNNYKEKQVSVLKVYTAALIESEATAP